MINNKIEIITGRKGQGKSSLAYHRARLANKGVVIFDPNGQFAIGRTVHTAHDLAQALNEPASPVVFQPTGGVADGFAEFFDVIFTRRRISVVVDEASLLGSPQRIDENLDKLIRLGRTKQLDVFLTAHRPQDFHGIVFELADAYCFFHATHPNSLRRIEEFTSEKASARVQQLSRHQFLCWSVETESFYVNTQPEGWREEISPEPEPELDEEEEVYRDGRRLS